MRATIVLCVIASCDAGRIVAPPTPPAPVVVDAAPAPIVADAGIAPDTTPLRPVGMTGPFATVVDACHSAKPCGETGIDYGDHGTKPATKTSCPAIESSDFVDPNAFEPDESRTASVAHASGGIEMRIGSQRCDVPQNLRREQDIYFMFVKRADGWWRSDPLWQWSYNDKYETGTMHVRWNDQPGRTFAGIAAGLDALECGKQGQSHTTDELMVRVEPGTAKPLVWGPLFVGARYEQAPIAELSLDAPCPAIKTAQELTERWTSPDDLELTGSATSPGSGDVLQIGWYSRNTGPSSVRRYRFVRP